MALLEAVIISDKKRELCGTYCAQMLWMISKGIMKHEIPAYTEIIGAEGTRDTRTGAQIIDDLIKGLEGGG